jgi:hypothetical protein
MAGDRGNGLVRGKGELEMDGEMRIGKDWKGVKYMGKRGWEGVVRPAGRDRADEAGEKELMRHGAEGRGEWLIGNGKGLVD